VAAACGRHSWLQRSRRPARERAPRSSPVAANESGRHGGTAARAVTCRTRTASGTSADGACERSVPGGHPDGADRCATNNGSRWKSLVWLIAVSGSRVVLTDSANGHATHFLGVEDEGPVWQSRCVPYHV
jgi:hypothetical protein